jgi:alanine racemase
MMRPVNTTHDLRAAVAGALSWCEVSRGALEHNARELKRMLQPHSMLAPVVKGNAYGHGTVTAARAFVSGGADWLCVFDLDEARELRAAGIHQPICVLGRVPDCRMAEAIALQTRLVVFDFPNAQAAAAAAHEAGSLALLHVEVETGNHRQGLDPGPAFELCRAIAHLPGAKLEGVATHFADVEDTTDHTYARSQLAQFDDLLSALSAHSILPEVIHCSNSAAAILWPQAHRSLVRTGIAAYGMWPSKETFVSALMAHRHTLDLRPALVWKARVVQVRDVAAGAYIGYGRTFRTTHTTRLATLAVGYRDGYDRHLSNRAHVLLGGVRAPVRGRVCMNLLMVDVTDTPPVHVDDAAVLLGQDSEDRITAEQLAEWTGTINYEVTTRISDRLARLEVP